jgi:FtsZ-binding cell division protein ZapB
MDEAERRINQEREDRIKYHDDHLNPIRTQLKGIQDGLVKEKKTRITNEKKVMQEIRDESKNMQDDIKKEHEMRQQRMQDLDDQMT